VLVAGINTFYGLSMMANDVTELGKSILKYVRDFKTLAVFTAQHDRLPDFFLKDNLPPHDSTFMIKDEELYRIFYW